MIHQYFIHKKHHVIANHCHNVSSWVSSNGGIILYAHDFIHTEYHVILFFIIVQEMIK